MDARAKWLSYMVLPIGRALGCMAPLGEDMQGSRARSGAAGSPSRTRRLFFSRFFLFFESGIVAGIISHRRRSVDESDVLEPGRVSLEEESLDAALSDGDQERHHGTATVEGHH